MRSISILSPVTLATEYFRRSSLPVDNQMGDLVNLTLLLDMYRGFWLQYIRCNSKITNSNYTRALSQDRLHSEIQGMGHRASA